MTVLALVSAAVPPQPDPDDARRLAEEELSRHVYDAAQPTVIDRIAGAVVDFFDSLTLRGVGVSWSPIIVVLVIVVIAALVVVGLLVWGRPKLAHRQPRPSALLFGEDDLRSSAELRADADAHAEAGRWEEAIADRFRALARAMDERDILDPVPGMTAVGLSGIAAGFFPSHEAGLRTSASHFDDVRYLRRPGTAQMYADVVASDDAIAASRPAKLAPAFGGVS